ncbi:MAG: hypothetical protein KA807_04925 [Prolixibacteraceae bacterium]|nr:hypothetical protein [Prolixibacteraceae bacterium]
MKNKKILLLIFIPVILIMLLNCDETILRDDCEEFDDIQLTIKGKYSTECEPDVILPARGAAIKIIAAGDTLFTGNLDSTGTFDTGDIENSGCGLNNAVIETSYKGSTFSEKFGILCCDTTLTYIFKDISCEEQKPIDCQSIDTIITRTITSYGECVMINAAYSELKNNVVLIASNSPLRIDIGELMRLTGGIFVRTILPSPSGNSVVIPNGQIEIYFDVVRDMVDTIGPVIVNLPAFCLDNSGNDVSSGNIKLELSSFICDPLNCLCPFGKNDKAELFYAPDKVTVGESKNFGFTILELTDGNFGVGCSLKIDSIKRAGGGDAYTLGTDSWKIETVNPSDLEIGDYLYITTLFEPKKAGEITEEFVVYTSVYSENNPNNKENTDECSFRFKLRGEGCNMICPSIIPLATLVKKVYTNPFKEEIVYRGDKIDMSNEFYISQKIKGTMTTDCLEEMQEPGLAVFKIDIPDGDYCSDINLDIQKRTNTGNNDYEFFFTNISNLSIGDILNTSLLTVTFIPPSMKQFYDNNYDNKFNCVFDLIASDDEGKEICRQEIRIESEVEEFSIGSREVVIMEAFSQISSKSKVPSHHIYDIDTYNPKLKNYGLREALTDEYINDLVIPNVPISDHSLYFDVDSPDDPTANFTQKPELYLVNTVLNNFSKISASSVTSFNTHDEFIAAYENGSLMNLIMNDPKAGFSNGSFTWADSRDKSDFIGNNGIAINPYEVYIVWNPDSQSDDYTVEGNKSRHIFCGMALVYISSVKSGSNNTDNATGGMGKANVSFYVEYPLMWDE